MGKANGFVWGFLAGAAAVVGAAVLKRAVDEKKEKEIHEELVEIQKVIEEE